MDANSLETKENSKVFLGVKDIQGRTGLSRDRAYRLRQSKNFPSFMIGRQYFVTVDEYDKWLKNSANKKY